MFDTDTLFDFEKEFDTPQFRMNKQQTKDFIISEIRFTQSASQREKISQGSYTTISFKNPEIDLNSLKLIIKLKLAKYMEKAVPKKLLILGLGNENITADSFGVLVSKKIEVNIPEKCNRKIYSISPSVKGLTGLDSDLIVKMFCNTIKPDLIIVADSLMTKNTNHLMNLIQISDTAFDFGINNNPKRNILKTMSAYKSIISIGFPTTIRGKMISEHVNPEVIFAPANVDAAIETISAAVAKAINELVSYQS